MATSVVITIQSEKTQSDLQAQLQSATNQDREGMQAVAHLLTSLAARHTRGVVSVQTAATAPVAATGTLTVTSAVATDAISVAGVTFTATSTPTLATDWEIDGASDILDAASLAAAINANTTANKIVTASVAGTNVITITAKQPGLVGNFIPLSSADATIVASVALLAGGTGGATDTARVYHAGL